MHGFKHATASDFGHTCMVIGIGLVNKELWDRSLNAVEISALKTTMIVELHWCRLKHEYLQALTDPEYI